MEIYLIRHTTPDVPAGTCYGATDVPLTDSFDAEWEEIAGQIPSGWDAVWHSPLSRCARLAQRLASDQVKVDPRLAELDFGAWEMKLWDDIDQNRLSEWMTDFVHVAPEKGETFIAMQQRVLSAWEELQALGYDRIACVTHAGPIRAILSNVLGFPLSNAFSLDIKYGSISKLILKRGVMRLSLYNA